MVKYDYIKKKVHPFISKVAGSVPGCSSLNVKVFLGKILNPKLLYAYQRMNVGQKTEKSARING